MNSSNSSRRRLTESVHELVGVADVAHALIELKSVIYRTLFYALYLSSINKKKAIIFLLYTFPAYHFTFAFSLSLDPAPGDPHPGGVSPR